MAEKELLIKEKIEQEGLFTFKDFYKYAHQWFKDEKYDSIIEEKYQEKLSGNEKELVIEWKTSKKLSDYFKAEISIKMEVLNMIEVEAEIDGKKKKTNKGKVSAEIKGTLVRDPESKWNSTPFYRFIHEIYSKYVIPARVNELNDKVVDDVRDFKDYLKVFFSHQGLRK